MNQNNSDIIEVRHRLAVGGMLPIDYAYPLYSALKGAVNQDYRFFEQFRISTLSLSATQEPSILRTHKGSFLAYRGPRERAEELRKALNGKPLMVGGGAVLVQQGHERKILASSRLDSHFVALGDGDVDQYAEKVRAGLREKYGVDASEVLVDRKLRSRKMNKYKAEVFGRRVHVKVDDPEVSLAIQRYGLGPRGSLGAGWFESTLRAPLWR